MLKVVLVPGLVEQKDSKIGLPTFGPTNAWRLHSRSAARSKARIVGPPLVVYCPERACNRWQVVPDLLDLGDAASIA